MRVLGKILLAESPCIAKISPELTQVRTVSILAGYGRLTPAGCDLGVLIKPWKLRRIELNNNEQYKDNKMLLWCEYGLINSCFLKVVETECKWHVGESLLKTATAYCQQEKLRLLKQFASVFMKNLTKPSS